MTDPYRMVVISFLSAISLLMGLLIYKYIYPKRKINLMFFLIIVTIIPTFSIFRTGVYESGDFSIHIYRTIEFFKSLSEGSIMPSWSANLNATYGYPLFIFNYTLPYYILSLFHLIGFSFIDSMKIFLALNVVLSGIFMFLFARKIFKSDFIAFTSAIFYVFAPYHLVDIHFKVVIGEILFFTILPLAFLFLHKMLRRKSLLNLLFFSVTFSALIMSHLVIAFFSGIFMVFYVFINQPKGTHRSLFLYVSSSFLISLLISLYLWLGPIFLSKYSYIQNVALGTAYFPTLRDMLYSPWRMGLLFQGPQGEISHVLGYPHIFVIISLLTLLFFKKIPKIITPNISFLLISLGITIFFISPYSKFIWEAFPDIKVVGSHRLLILSSFLTSVLAGYFIFIIKKQSLACILIAIAIGSTILNWGQRRVVPEITDSVLKVNLWKSTSEGEAHFYANTKWVNVDTPWFSKLPKNHSEITNGSGKIRDVFRSSTVHKYIIEADTNLKIKENTLYYPGWEAKLNEEILPLYPDADGAISLWVPKGNYSLTLTYRDVSTYKIIKIISLTSLLAVLGSIIFLLFIKRHAKK